MSTSTNRPTPPPGPRRGPHPQPFKEALEGTLAAHAGALADLAAVERREREGSGQERRDARSAPSDRP